MDLNNDSGAVSKLQFILEMNHPLICRENPIMLCFGLEPRHDRFVQALKSEIINVLRTVYIYIYVYIYIDAKYTVLKTFLISFFVLEQNGIEDRVGFGAGKRGNQINVTWSVS